MSNITLTTEFETDGGSRVHIVEHLGNETWVTTTILGKHDSQTVVIPWADWEKFIDRTATKMASAPTKKAKPRKKASKK